MAAAQVVETSVSSTNPSQGLAHLDDPISQAIGPICAGTLTRGQLTQWPSQQPCETIPGEPSWFLPSSCLHKSLRPENKNKKINT